MDGQAGMNSGGLLRARDGVNYLHGGDLASTWVTKHEVHAERVVTLVKQSLQLDIVANNENYALAA